MKLAEYAAQRRCPVCALSEEVRQELQDAYVNGVRYSAMSGWLREFHDKPIFYDKLKQHFLARHHERTA